MSAPSRVALARLHAQRIHGSSFRSPVEAVRWMGAMQAQDLPGGKWSVGLRVPESTIGSVDRSLNSGHLVRAWPMRGTLHFVAAEDLGWMLSLTADRMTASARSRYAQLGLDDAVFAHARRIAEASLDGGRSLTRRELLAAFDTAGIATRGRGSHLIGQLAITGVLCLGPIDHPHPDDPDATETTGATGQRIVLAEEWIENPRSLERDAALGEFAARYFASHGPATEQDLAHWTKLPLKEIRRGIEVAADLVVRVEVDGEWFFCSPATADALERDGALDPERPLDLLPGFDEFILGYRDRTAALAQEHFDRVVPGGNGMFFPTVVRDGRVIGTWKRTVSSKSVAIEPTMFPGERAPSGRMLDTAARRYASYLGLPLSGPVSAAR